MSLEELLEKPTGELTEEELNQLKNSGIPHLEDVAKMVEEMLEEGGDSREGQ